MANVVPLRAPRGPSAEWQRPPPTDGATALKEEKPSAIIIEIASNGGVSVEEQTRRRRSRPSKAFDRNLAEDIPEGALNALAQYIIEAVEADEQDRREWTETADQAAAFLGIKLDNPSGTTAEDGTVCKSVATCLLEALVKLWSTGYAELLPAEGPVKVERQDQSPPASMGDQNSSSGDAGPGIAGAAPPADPGIGHNGGPGGPLPGEDPKLAGDDLADALERDMNWYLRMGDRGYYPDTSKMLFHRYLVGVQVKEVYDCPLAGKPISRWIRIQDFIVHGDPAHLNESRRHTVRKRVPQSEMRRMMVKGHYRDITLNRPTGEVSSTEIIVGQTVGISPVPTLPRDYDHLVYQTHLELGGGLFDDMPGGLEALDEDETGSVPGYPLPYIVTIDKDTRAVLRIARAWEKGDKDHRREPRFVKYGFIPGDTWYDLGLIHLVGNPTQSATMLERSAVDAGIFSNFPGWLMKQGPASKLEDTIIRLQPGEVAKIPVTGSDKLQESFIPVPYKPPSAEALQLAAALEAKVKSIAGIVELPVGEGRIGNTPVGTIMSYIESTTMVPGAVHKMDHIAMAEELSLLRRLIARRPKVLWQGNPSPARKWQIGKELHAVNLSPSSDPNVPSLMHRLMKVQGRVTLAGLPQFTGLVNQRNVLMDAFMVLGGDVDKYMNPPMPVPPPQPDPKLAVAQLKAQSDQTVQGMKNQAMEAERQAKLRQAEMESDDRESDREAANQREAMKVDLQRHKTGADMAAQGATAAHDAQQASIDRAHEAGMQQRDHAAQQQQSAQDRAAAAQQQQADHAQDTLNQSMANQNQEQNPKGGGKQ